MNKSILLVLCDFLLISVLALVEFTPPQEKQQQAEQAALFQEGAQADMVELLRLSLENESDTNKNLSENLKESEDALSQTSEKLEQTQAERERLAAERERLAAEKAQLSNQIDATTTTLSQTQAERDQLSTHLSQQAAQSEALQVELKERLDALAKAKASLQESKSAMESLEKRQQSLETNLKIEQTEKNMLTQNLVAAKAEIETIRLERQAADRRAETLAQGVNQLAEQSSVLQQEIRRGQPVSSNLIFSQYEKNRLTITFQSTQSLTFGTRQQTHTLDAILVEDQGSVYALFDASQTPFKPETLEQLIQANGRFKISNQLYDVLEINFLTTDPRILSIQIPKPLVEKANLTPFRLAEDPLRFPQAVLISNQLGDYGTIDFKLIPGGKRYLSVERQLLGSLFGEFTSSRGDYVFAQSGELIGLMVERSRGAILSNLKTTDHLKLADNFDSTDLRQLKSTIEAQLKSVQNPNTNNISPGATTGEIPRRRP